MRLLESLMGHFDPRCWQKAEWVESTRIEGKRAQQAEQPHMRGVGSLGIPEWAHRHMDPLEKTQPDSVA